jgi:hypothetical protein
MLNKLFGSEARVKILNLFLTNPDEKHYLRQIARDLGLQVNSVRRELLNLENIQLILPLPEQEKDRKYYIVNRSFLLFLELKSLFSKAQTISARDLADKIAAVCKPKLLILCGFFVGNLEARTDLLIVGRINRLEFTTLVKELEQALNREINYTILDEKEYLYRRAVMDFFIHKIVEGKKIVVVDNINQ